MHKHIIIAIVAATLLATLVSASIATTENANAQNNKTGSGNATTANTTKIMSNATLTKAKNSTGPVVGAAGGSIGGAKAVTGSK